MKVTIELNIDLVDGDYRLSDWPELRECISRELPAAYNSDRWVFMMSKERINFIPFGCDL